MIAPPLEADDDMGLLERLLGQRFAAAIGGRRAAPASPAARPASSASARSDELVVVDRAGGGDDRRRRAVVAAQIGVDRRAIEAADALAGAEDRPADRLIGPGAGGEEIEHEIVGRVLDRADLLHDDVLLALEFVGIELAVGENVGEHVEREVDVLAQHTGEIAGLLDAGLRVEVAADVLDRLGDLARVAPARALERHVLEQDATGRARRALVARAGARRTRRARRSADAGSRR